MLAHSGCEVDDYALQRRPVRSVTHERRTVRNRSGGDRICRTCGCGQGESEQERCEKTHVRGFRMRYLWTWIASAVVLAVIIAVGLSIAQNPNIDHAAIAQYQFAPAILAGLRTTLELAIISGAIGLGLGLGLALMRLSHNPVLRWASGAYTWAFRGTPLLGSNFVLGKSRTALQTRRHFHSVHRHRTRFGRDELDRHAVRCLDPRARSQRRCLHVRDHSRWNSRGAERSSRCGSCARYVKWSDDAQEWCCRKRSR